MSAATDALIAQERLPAEYAGIVAEYWAPLADELVRRKRPGQALLVAVNGGQGSGKTTLCRFLEVLLAERGLRAATLALDDFYLPLAARQELAATVHPLFATRGVPGTHEVAAMHGAFDALLAGGDACVPQFDKAHDDRSAQARPIAGPVDIILFEGWCVACPPQDDAALAIPVNPLEEQEDASGEWRAEVNRQLRGPYADLFGRMDMLVMLAVPGIAAVRANRALQERKLAETRPGAAAVMNEAALDRFIMHYERLTTHMLERLPQQADIVVRIGNDHRPVGWPDGLARPGAVA